MDNLFKSFKTKAEGLVETVKKKGGDIAQSVKLKPEEFFEAVARDECETVKGSLKWVIFANNRDSFGSSHGPGRESRQEASGIGGLQQGR